MKTIGETLPEEMARVRKLILIYRELPNNVGEIAARMIEASLQNADKAVMSGDIIAMLQAYEDLKGYSE